MVASFAAELLKMRKRPAIWVLGLIWIAVIVLLAYTLTYVFLSNAPAPSAPKNAPPEAKKQIEQQQKEAQKQQLELLYPKNLISNTISGFPNLGGPIALILGALAMGSEYGWTTLKTILSQRPGRLNIFFGKILALAVILVLLVVLGFAAGAACSYVIAGLDDAPLNWPSLGELARAAGAGALIFALWAAMGVFLAALLRSTALSIGIGLVYALAIEALIFSLPIQNQTFKDAREFFPGQNSTFLANSFVSQDLPQGFRPPEPPVDAGQAALVIAAYTAAFVLLAALFLRRRDVT